MRPLAFVVAVGVVAVLNACGEPTSITALQDNRDVKFSVSAMNGTPTTLASAILVQQAIPVRMNAGLNFDVALDLKSADSVAIYTVGTIASELTHPHRVGLQLAKVAFDDALVAPTSGYVYDSSLVVGVGTAFFVDVLEVSCTGSILGTNIRGKVQVDSLSFSDRLIYLHVVSDPNCGFKSLAPGKPKD